MEDTIYTYLLVDENDLILNFHRCIDKPKFGNHNHTPDKVLPTEDPGGKMKWKSWGKPVPDSVLALGIPHYLHGNKIENAEGDEIV